MFKGIMSNELRDHILDNIDSLDAFVDVIIEKNKLELDTRKSLFAKDAKRIAGEIITSYFENEFFNVLEDAMLEAYEENYEAFVAKENADTPNIEGETTEDKHE